MSSKEIFVYENWSSPSPKWLGTLYVSFLRGKETYSFEFSKSFLSTDPPFFLDPALSFFPGRQYASDGFLFGTFSDACPDRWGRTLMKRREAPRANSSESRPRFTKAIICWGASILAAWGRCASPNPLTVLS